MLYNMDSYGRSSKIPHDYLLKIIIIGDSGVGKSSLLMRFAEGSFTSSFITTIGIDFKVKIIDIDGKKVKLQIWDTAGQERFRTITTAYYKNAMGVLLVYDVTDKPSFDHIRYWIRDINAHGEANVCKIIVGNKNDMTSNKVVMTEDIQKLSEEYGVTYYETSAKDDINVTKIFTDISRLIIQKQKEKASTLLSVPITNHQIENRKLCCKTS